MEPRSRAIIECGQKGPIFPAGGKSTDPDNIWLCVIQTDTFTVNYKLESNSLWSVHSVRYDTIKYSFLLDPCAHGVRSLGRLSMSLCLYLSMSLCLYLSMSRFWNLVKTVNVVNVDTLVDDHSEDLSWRPYLMTLVDDQLEDLADLTLIDENIARGTTDPWVDTITGGTL